MGGANVSENSDPVTENPGTTGYGYGGKGFKDMNIPELSN